MEVWRCLREQGVPEKYVRLAKDTYEDARVVISQAMCLPKSVRLKDRDYDVTAHIFLILSLTCTPKSVMGR